MSSPIQRPSTTSATLVATRLRELVPAGDVAKVYTSDLRRASQTAEVIAEGKPQAWLDERFVPPPATGDRMNHHEGIDGAETRRELATRVYAALDDILAADCAHQVVVTHGFAHTFVVAAWIHMPLASAGSVAFGSSTGGITVLQQDDCFNNRAVVALSDTTHLGG